MSTRRTDALLCAVCDDRDETKACDAVERVKRAFDAGDDALSEVEGRSRFCSPLMPMSAALESPP
jgi:hypothetical protein